MSWMSAIVGTSHDRRDNNQHLRARQRASTRAKLVTNLRNAAQGLAAYEAKELSEGGRAVPGKPSDGGARPLIGGDTVEARAVTSALEQCLFHGIRSKEFGVIPFWAFLERVERIPLSHSAGSRPGMRERQLSTVRNTVGAVASLESVRTPLGRARAWIRQCLVCKCLGACVSALFEEDRLLKVFYEATSLARCREGSTILLRLCAALEAFDVQIDPNQSALDTRPRWPIIDEEAEWDRRMEQAAGAAARGHATGGRQGGGAADESPQERSWFERQRERQHQEQREEGRGLPERGNWATSALAEIDQFAQGETWDKIDGVLATVSSRVDQAVQSLDETIQDLFGDHDDGEHASAEHPPHHSNATSHASGSRRVVHDGWLELRGGDALQTPSSFLDQPGTHAGRSKDRPDGIGDARAPGGGSFHAGPPAGGALGAYPGAFVMGRRRGAAGKGRVFGVPLQELIMSAERCKTGLLDPAIGVPDAVSSLLEALKHHGGGKNHGLFSRDASEHDLLRVVKSLEKRNRVPSASHIESSSPAWLVSRLTGEDGAGAEGKVAPHVLASALLFFLYRLPEPLLTFRRREAFLSCEAIPDLEARIRNVKLLVEDLPWAHRPLLLALAEVFHAEEASPKRSMSGAGADSLRLEQIAAVHDGADLTVAGDMDPGVSVRDAAEALAPALLRHPPNRQREGGEESSRPDWEEEMAATAVMELILSEQDAVLEGLRTEQRLRRDRLARKLERVGQLQKMLAATVFLERPTHLAVVISIWRRLEDVEYEILEDTALRGEDDLGINNPSRQTLGEPPKSQGHSTGSGSDARPSSASAPAASTAAVSADEDQDVRELESMLMGLDGSDAWAADGTVAEVTKLFGAGQAAVASATDVGTSRGAPGGARPDGVDGHGVKDLQSIRSDEGGSGVSEEKTSKREPAAGAGAGAGADAGTAEVDAAEGVLGAESAALARSLSPLAFTIEDDAEDEHQAPHARSPPASLRPVRSRAPSTADEMLLESIAATLAPSGVGEEDAEVEDVAADGVPLPATDSELALVTLMAEAGSEAGQLPGAVSRAETDANKTLEGGARSTAARDGAEQEQLGIRRGESSFDDLLAAGTSVFGSGAASSADSPATVTASDERDATDGIMDEDGASHVAAGTAAAVKAEVEQARDGNKPSQNADAGVSPPDAAAAKDGRAAANATFSLTHDRWETCGFTSGLAANRGGREARVSDALRGASTVLALDSLNYFMARYPRSAARVIKSCARRHAVVGGGLDSEPFSVHAGDITRVVADLLSLSRPPPASERVDDSAEGEGGLRGGREADGADEHALKMASLPSWGLLSDAHAFQEAFACGALVMEAAHAAEGREPRPLRYQESLLETRRVLHACIMHAPSSVDGFWAAAAAEGGVSPDPEDTQLPPPPSRPAPSDGTEGVRDETDGAKESALAEKLERTLGLSNLDLREEDTAALSDLGRQEGSVHLSAEDVSVDDRLCFGDAAASSASLRSGGSRVSSDWLLAGETARAGMIESIAEENVGSSGPLVVCEGAFRARLLRSSQIIDANHASALARHLPETVASMDWVCLFADSRHGASLETLLARCAGWEPTLVIVEALPKASPLEDINTPGTSAARSEGSGGLYDGDAGGVTTEHDRDGAEESCGEGRGRKGTPAKKTVVFGGFASGSAWHSMGRAFSGDGSSFLFSFHGHGGAEVGEGASRETRAQSAADHEGDGDVSVFPWAGSNRSFMTSDTAFGLGMGAGGSDGSFGFFMDPDLREGSTGTCDTFANAPLIPARRSHAFVVGETAGSDSGSSRGAGAGGGSAHSSRDEMFDVMALEVWGFRIAKTPKDLTRVAL